MIFISDKNETLSDAFSFKTVVFSFVIYTLNVNAQIGFSILLRNNLILGLLLFFKRKENIGSVFNKQS